MRPRLDYESVQPKPKKHRWYTETKEAAPVAFVFGAVAGASWPFTSIFVVSLFATGANVFELGQKGNGADNALACVAAASFGGPITLAALIVATMGGYQAGGWLGAKLWLALTHREQVRAEGSSKPSRLHHIDETTPRWRACL